MRPVDIIEASGRVAFAALTPVSDIATRKRHSCCSTASKMQHCFISLTHSYYTYLEDAEKRQESL